MSTTHLASSASPDEENFTTSRLSMGIERTTPMESTVALQKDERIPTGDNLSFNKIPATTPQLPPVSLTTEDPGRSPLRYYRTVALLIISLVISCLFYCLRFGPCKLFKINEKKCRMSISIPLLNLSDRVIGKNSVKHDDHVKKDHQNLTIVWEKS